MEDFADVSRARNAYKTFSEALSAGREIMKRAGVPDPPPIPEFELVYKRLDAASRRELFNELRGMPELAARDAIRIWTPLIKRAMGGPARRN